MAEPLQFKRDTFSPWLLSVIENAPGWKRKSLKSLGWMMQKEIKAGIKSGAPGGQRYRRTMPARFQNKKGVMVGRRRLEEVFGNEAKSSYPVLGRLVQAIGYQYQPTNDSVETGWLSKSAADIGGKAEAGVERNVSEGMRGKFAIAGMPLRQTTTKIIVPERPTIDPMHRMLEPKIEPYMAQKIFQYMDEGAPASVKPKRKYIVYR